MKNTLIAIAALLAINAYADEGMWMPQQVPQLAGLRVTAEIEFTFDKMIARAVAKIAFNYLAKTQGADFVLPQDFDSVRRFIRHSEGQPPRANPETLGVFLKTTKRRAY